MANRGIITTIDLLRHGEPKGGARYRGVTDDPLSARGWQQMTDALGEHSGERSPWSAILTSPLCRCKDFASRLAEQHEQPLHIEPRFSEIHFGDWEGQTSQTILEQNPEALSRYWQDPINTTPPGGETLTAFSYRVSAAWQESIAQHRGKHLLAVLHGGVIRVILQQVLAMPLSAIFRIDVPFACVSRVLIMHGEDMDQSQLIFHGGRPQ